MAESKEPAKVSPPEPAQAVKPALLPAAESSDPDVHFALGNLQAARSGGNADEIAAAQAVLAALGYA